MSHHRRPECFCVSDLHWNPCGRPMQSRQINVAGHSYMVACQFRRRVQFLSAWRIADEPEAGTGPRPRSSGFTSARLRVRWCCRWTRSRPFRRSTTRALASPAVAPSPAFTGRCTTARTGVFVVRAGLCVPAPGADSQRPFVGRRRYKIRPSQPCHRDITRRLAAAAERAPCARRSVG